MGFNEVMELPTTFFWTLNRNLSRLFAEEDLRAITVARAGQVQSADAIKEITESLRQEMGTTTVITNEVFDRSGYNKLKALAGARK